MVGMRSMPDNLSDGHTLAETLEQVGVLTSSDCKPKTAVADIGKRGVQIEGVRILMSEHRRGINLALTTRDPSAQCDPTGGRTHEDGRPARQKSAKVPRAIRCMR